MNEKDLLTEQYGLYDKSTKPFYKKKGSIIFFGSVLGLGTFAGIGAAGSLLYITLNNASNESNIIGPSEILEVVNILNQENNKDTRLSFWNKFINFLNTPTTSDINDTPLNKLIKDDNFIDDFISFLTDNLYINPDNKIPKTVTSADQIRIQRTLRDVSNKPLFKDDTLSDFSNFFQFSASKSAIMFTFQNHSTDPTIQFSLSIPFSSFAINDSGWDLSYNTDSTIDIDIKSHIVNADNSITNDKNIQLIIDKFVNPKITTKRAIYFKVGKTPFPTAMIKEFKFFFNNMMNQEISSRRFLENNFSLIQNYIKNDSSQTVGLSYWNSFAMNYVISNQKYISEDLRRGKDASTILTWVRENAKLPNGTFISDQDLNLLSNAGIAGILQLGETPLVSLPSSKSVLFFDQIFETPNKAEYSWKMELDVSNFSFEYIINNLFNGPTAITFTPRLTFGATLTKVSRDGTSIVYEMDEKVYNISNIINTSNDTSITNGGIVGFFIDLSMNPYGDLSAATNGLTILNSSNANEQINFWNNFVNNNSSFMTSSLKSPDVFYNFLIDNIDFTNIFGMNGFPDSSDIDLNVFKESLNSLMSSISDSRVRFSFNNSGIEQIFLERVRAGSSSNYAFFTKVTLYLGHEENSIDSFKYISKTNGDTSAAVSQKIAPPSNLSTVPSVHEAGSKRISVVLETGYGVGYERAYVFYLGQFKSNDNPSIQFTKPITLPKSILNSGGKFLEAIKKL